LLNRILQPYFVWRPSQFFRALSQKWAKPTATASTVLPWGATIRFPGHDLIARHLLMYGITGMEACEAVCRLLDPGETAVDAGANVGTVSSCMMHRVGKTGRVMAFEMMPATYQFLNENYQAWKPLCPNSEAVQLALSDRETTVNIGLSPDFHQNSGVAYARHGEVHPGHEHLTAAAKPLDAFFPAPEKIHFLKLDVERHEHEVLLGARELMSSRRIRDIVFEDIKGMETPVKTYLREQGYALFTMTPKLMGVELEPFQPQGDATTLDENAYADFLATLEVDRLKKRWASRGYQCLK
jgi:FkbM family methyltransferase